jgi:hypothetical protein
VEPFDSYPQGGQKLLGPPRRGAAVARGANSYGHPIGDLCGWKCAYCDADLATTYEAWLNLSVDHVVPRSTGKLLGLPDEWIEDTTNHVACCRTCNEFLNGYRGPGLASEAMTLDGFYRLRDAAFAAKLTLALERHQRERTWYDKWRLE